ncbi:hypothetical protein RNJ44_02120 [Nakaseomyces bracarensis]|uniref:Rad61 Wapl domain-containing protein n=1 Tax=Nakaseomyces bracarensis TaxID=273131 RepID=A0ABR4NMJ4_9SACH
MKVYGRRSKPIKRPAEIIDFSDEETEIISNDSGLEYSKETSPSDQTEENLVSKEDIDNKDDRSVDDLKNAPRSDGFDELFSDTVLVGTSKLKKRKTYRKQISITSESNVESDEEEFNRSTDHETSIRDISDYLDQIQKQDCEARSIILNKVAETDDDKKEPMTHHESIEKAYGIKRTYLVDNTADNGEQKNEKEPVESNNANDALESSTTQHYRALTSMGSKLQYEDEVTELFQEFNNTKSHEDSIAALLEFIININNDLELLEYITKSNFKEFSNIIFRNRFLQISNPFVSLLLSDILLLLPNKRHVNDSLNTMVSSIYTCLLSQGDKDIANYDYHSYKHYREYLKLSQSNSKSIFQVGLELIIDYPKSIETLSQNDTLNIILLITQVFNKKLQKQHKLIEEEFFKALILLTNNLPRIFKHSKEVENLFHQLLHNSLQTIKTHSIKDEKCILSIALCLNTLLCFPINYKPEIIDYLRDTLTQLLGTLESEDQSNSISLQFLLLCYLNMCEERYILKTDITEDKKKVIETKILQILYSINGVNEVIQNNVILCASKFTHIS